MTPGRSATWLVARRELASYLATPLGYALATAFLLVEGLLFWTALTALSAPDAPNANAIELFFGGNLYFWIAQLAFVPLVTMRVVAGERQTGTLELLLSSPVSAAAIVVGKFAGAYAFYLALWVPTAAYVLFVALHGGVDGGAVLAGYAGVAIVGAALVAVGVLASVLAPSPVVAGGATFASLLVLLGVGQLEVYTTPGSTVASYIDYVSLSAAMSDFGRGLVDTRRIAFPASLAALALFFAARALEWRRLR